jgi:parvulin-like peptidyl-prolyl isomerase
MSPRHRHAPVKHNTKTMETRPRICLALVAVGSLLTCEARALASQSESAAKPDVRIAARVNGEPVTRADVQQLLANVRERQLVVRDAGGESADSQALDRAALTRLIDRRLILQEARRRKVTVSEKELADAVSSLRRRFEDLQSLGLWMKEQGLDDKTLFETARTEMLAARVRAALVKDVQVAGDRVEQYYAAHKENLKTQEVRLQIIVVKDEATGTDIMAALKKGEDFGALAQQHSIGVRSAKGGDTSWIDVETLGPPLRDAVGAMKARQARGPLKKGDEFLIVRLDDRRQGRAKTLAEARPEIERRLLPAAQQEAVQKWLATQKKNAKIEFLDQTQ